MSVCDGRGNSGTHCCWIDGEECEFVVWREEPCDHPSPCRDYPHERRAWCGVWNLMDTPEWHASKIGRMFLEWYGDPKLTCRDYPQNIPDFPEGGRCCWKGVMPDGNVG